MTIHETMIAVRLESGMTQVELAKAMRTTQSAIARMEGGRTLPTFQTLEMLAAVTGKRLEVRFI